MCPRLSSFAILRLNNSVELNCAGIKETNPKPEASNVSRDCSKAVRATLDLAVWHGSGLLAIPSCSEVQSAMAGSLMPPPFFLEAFLSVEPVQAEKCLLHLQGAQRQP